MEVLIWVLKNGEGRSLKDLYRFSRFSEPTVRTRVQELLAQGLISIAVDGVDSRRHIVRPTDKLRQVMSEYVALLHHVAAAPLCVPSEERRADH